MADSSQPAAPDSALRRWRARRVVIVITCIVLIALLVVVDQRGWLLAGRDDDLARYDKRTVSVLRVLDDGLLEIDMRDALHRSPVTRVRVWGVALPDADDDGHLQATLEWLRQRLSTHGSSTPDSSTQGSSVTLDLEPHRTRDARGNVLSHVLLDSGDALAAIMLRDGLAVRDERWPHQHLIEFAQHEQHARTRGLGCWGD